MRAIRLPAFVLVLLAAYILCNAAWASGVGRQWLDAADTAAAAALRGDTASAGQALEQLDALWQKPQGYLHIVVSHTELDETEDLLAQARAAVRQDDMAALYPIMQTLRSQFRLLAETQQVSLKNIL